MHGPVTSKPLVSGGRSAATRSEEHTSELQSRGHLVCRLLLAKKKASVRGTRVLLSYFAKPLVPDVLRAVPLVTVPRHAPALLTASVQFATPSASLTLRHAARV